VTYQTPDAQVDEGNLRLVREFLRREFRDACHDDYFDRAKAAQVFLIDNTRGLRHILVIPKATFEHVDFGLLCNTHLVDTLQRSQAVPVSLTPEGID
jgi:hypothetical protein